MVIRKWFGNPVIATGIALNVFIMIVAVLVKDSPYQLLRLLTEDGIVEWMQFLVFAMTSGLLGYAAIERWQRDGRFGLQVLALAGLCVVVAAAAMEEVSWFQRVLHVQSPEFFLQNNRQGETNLHNLALGKGGSIHKTILLKLIVLIGLTHNIVLPLLARTRPAVRAFVEKFGLYLPPLPAAVIYVSLVIVSQLIHHERKGELGEMFGAVHYMSTAFSAYFLGQNYSQPAVFENPSDTRRVAKLFACLMVFLMMTAWLLSTGTGAQMD